MRVGSRRPRCPSSVLHPLVVLIRSQPGMAERLLVEHADDGFGRCRTCSGGAQTGRHRWPCTLHHYATCALQQVEPVTGERTGVALVERPPRTRDRIA